MSPGRAAVALACLLATLVGCSSDDGRDCPTGGSATVTATGPDGQTWQARTTVTRDPPSVGGGYVLVQHPCGWTALDLDDGAVVRTGDGEAVGIAGGFVFTLDEDDSSVSGDPVVEGERPYGYSGMSVTRSGEDVQARTVDDRLYLFPDTDGAGGLSQYEGPDQRWEAVLPVLRQPTLTPVGKVLVVTSSDGSVYGIDLDAGTVRWRVLVSTVAVSLLRVRARGGQAVVTTLGSGVDEPPSVTVLDAATGERLDRTASPDPVDPPLEATVDGWTVAIESDPIPYVMDG